MARKISRGPGDKSKFVHQDIDADIEITDKETGEELQFKLGGLETQNTIYDKVDMADAIVVPTTTDWNFPSFKDDVEIHLNGETIYSGFVGEVKEYEEWTLAFKVKCFNSLRQLKTTAVDIGTDEDFVMASDMLENVILPRSEITKYNIDLDSLPTIALSNKHIKDQGSFDTPIQFEQDQAQAATLVDRLARHTNSLWWFDGKGTFRFGDPDTEVFKLSYVKDSSAGKTTPPYQSVKVIGSGSASQLPGGWRAGRLIPKRPVKAIRTLENVMNMDTRHQLQHATDDKIDRQEMDEQLADAYRVKQGDLIEPVFVFRDKSIKTQREANAIANMLINELIQQTRQGWVEIMGWERIEPFDVIEMPDFMGGEQYLVQGVEHTLDTSNGYITKVETGGLVHGGDISEWEGAFE